MSHRVVLAGLFHETHTFVDEITSLQDFQIRRDKEIFRSKGDSSPLGGFFEVAESYGWDVVPTVDYRASPSGIVEDDVVENFWKEFTTFAEPAISKGISAIYLVLHGAMTSQSMLDVEGEILDRIRQLLGTANIPIFGVFDLHANFTQRMAQNSNCLVAYRENPHADAKRAAKQAALLLNQCLEKGQIPRTFWHHPPLMWPPTGTGTATEPMSSLETLARTIESERDEIWTVNVIAGFSFADTPDTGVSFSLVTIGMEVEAKRKLEQLTQLAFELKEEGNVVESPIDEVMERICPVGNGPILLVEPSDNIGGGAPGDGTGVLRVLLEYQVKSAAVIINDPEAVNQVQALTPGDVTTMAVGGKGSRMDEGPVTLTVELVSTSDGAFELEDRQSHLAASLGDHIEMGPCAVVRHEGILILLTSRKTPPFDLGQLRSQGIEPTALSIIGVKAAVAHRRAYDPIAKSSYNVRTPGPCSSDLSRFPFKYIERPVYPLDDI